MREGDIVYIEVSSFGVGVGTEIKAFKVYSFKGYIGDSANISNEMNSAMQGRRNVISLHRIVQTDFDRRVRFKKHLGNAPHGNVQGIVGKHPELITEFI